MSHTTRDRQLKSCSGTSLSSQPRGQAPEALCIQVDLLIPTRGFRIIDDQDRELKTILEQIEHQHGVRIRISAPEDPLQISAASPKNAKEAIASILKSLVLREGHATVWNNTVLVAPPSFENKNAIQILLQENPGTTWFRPSVVVNTSAKAVDSSAAQAYKGDLKAAMVRVGDGLRYSPNRMRMRIAFGKLLFKERKRETASYTLEQFARLARRVSKRGTSHMEMRLGGESMCEKIQQALCLDPDFGRPTVTNNSIIVTTKNFNLELSVDGKHQGGFVFGALNAFHREKTHRSVEIASVCPEKTHDWVLTIESPIDANQTGCKLPLNYSTLTKGIKARNNTKADCIEPYVAASFAEAHAIEALISKTSSSYYVNGDYVVEVSKYKQWSTSKRQAQEPVIGVSLSMYRPEWDDAMVHANVSNGPRPWAAFPEEFFKSSMAPGDPTKDLDPVDALLYWIGKIQAVLDIVA
ncbi:hypothetical protein B0T20DRAFT_509446 [Sordaria brevicollis]|uniref:DUF7905 domain-containing protein n=1 Tax=Sordaria brevicollis TaxID=83679 RepID=A0AAE0U996_SORBR|nr:hypothetical protein B0T20DRAFT_509446 [Sordaria brevicollis]